MTQEQLKEILENHKKWLNDETGGIRANLSYAELIGANLSYANLRCANLNGANLEDANLVGAVLNGADLRGANLIDAVLEDAKLEDADLSGADLSGANLSGANLREANGNNREVKSLQFGKYITTILVNVRITIGCQNHRIPEWENFTDEEIHSMDDGALEWWKEWKEVILKVAKGVTNDTRS